MAPGRLLQRRWLAALQRLGRQDSAPGSHAAKIPTTKRKKGGEGLSVPLLFIILFAPRAYSGKFELTESGWGPASLIVGQSAVA